MVGEVAEAEGGAAELFEPAVDCIGRTVAGAGTHTHERCSTPCEDMAMGWQALEQWGDDVTRIEPLAGGVANQVWSVRSTGSSRSVVSAPAATLILRGRPICCDISTVQG